MTSKEWKICKLGNIIKLIGGGTPKTSISEYWNGNIPWISVKDFNNDNKKVYVTEKTITKLGLNKSATKLLQKGDIIISARGTVGEIAVVSKPMAFNQSCYGIKAIPNIVQDDFLYYLLKNSIQYLKHNTHGSVFDTITKETFEKINILLPPLEVQEKIAEVLSSLDNKIELNNRINNNLEQQAQAIFKSWFVDKENKNRKTCKAEEYFDISIGKTPPRKEPQWFTHQNSDTKWVSIADMGNCGVYICDTSEYLLPEAISKFNVCLVPKDTVILSFKLTVGRIAITNEMMTTNEAIAHFKTNNKTINEYLYLYLKNFNFKTMGSTSSIATAVNSKIIKAMPFIIPTNEELSIFHKITNPIFKQIKANQLESKNLTQIRYALLPKLMSGEIDVENIDISTDKLSFSIMIIEYFYIKIVIIIGVVNYKNNTFKWSNNPV